MVLGQRHWLTNHDTSNNEPREIKPFMVGKNSDGRCGQDILVRGLGLSALGKLDNETVKIAARFDIPHHEGAGGIEDFKNMSKE